MGRQARPAPASAREGGGAVTVDTEAPPEGRPKRSAKPPKAEGPPARQDYRSEFARSGLGYVLRLEEISTELRVHRIKRRSEETSAELVVKTRIMGIKTVNGVLHAARFNMSSSTMRERVGKLLSGRHPGIDVDWHYFLEELCQRTLEAEAAGEPVVEIGHDAIDKSKPRWAIDPLMPLRAPTLLYGPGGTGKSFIACAMAISVAGGREVVPGFAPAIKGKVLYLDWETSRDTVNARLIRIADGIDIEVPRGILYRRQNRPLADDAEDLSSIVADSGVIFVIIDSCGGAIGPQGEYGDANEGALKLFEAIRFLGPVSTLIVDHVSKTELVLAGKRGKVPYGSIYKINYSRQAWELRPVEKKAPDDPLRVGFHDFKRNDTAEHEPIGLRVDWKADTITFAPDSLAATTPEMPEPKGESEKATYADKIMELLDGARMKAPDDRHHPERQPRGDQDHPQPRQSLRARRTRLLDHRSRPHPPLRRHGHVPSPPHA
jgi:hypothetical protein